MYFSPSRKKQHSCKAQKRHKSHERCFSCDYACLTWPTPPTPPTPRPPTPPATPLPLSPPQQTWLGSAETGPSPRSAATMRPRRDWRDVKPERRSVNKGRELQILSWPRRLEQLKQRRLATNLTGSWFLGFFFFSLPLRWPSLPRLHRRPPVAWQLRSRLPGRSLLTYDLITLMSTDDRPRENNWRHQSGRGRYSFLRCLIISGMTWSLTHTHTRTGSKLIDYCFYFSCHVIITLTKKLLAAILWQLKHRLD